MGTPFPQDVTAGGVLIVPVIQSPNFSIADQTGWAIMSNGDAYFYNITAEGSVSSNTVVVSGSGEGVFLYSGAPASGNLVGSWAQASGTDAYGNAYPAGLSVGVSTEPQVLLAPGASGVAAEVRFPVSSPSLSNTGNIAAGLISGGDAVDLLVSGPALAASGKTDWVQLQLLSNNSASDGGASMQFIYVTTGGVAEVIASYDSSGWTFGVGVTVPYMTSPNGNPVFGWSQDSNYPLNTSVEEDSNSGEEWASGERAFMNNNWVASMNSTAAMCNYLYSVLQDAGIIEGG